MRSNKNLKVTDPHSTNIALLEKIIPRSNFTAAKKQNQICSALTASYFDT